MDAMQLAKTAIEFRQDVETDCVYGSSFAHARRVVLNALHATGVVYALAQYTERYQGNRAGGIAHTLELWMIDGDTHKLIKQRCITDQYDRSKDNTELFAMREIEVYASWYVRDSFIVSEGYWFKRTEPKLSVSTSWVKEGEGGCFLTIQQSIDGLEGYWSPSGGGYNVISRDVLFEENLRLPGEEFTQENLMRIIDNRGMRNPPPVSSARRPSLTA